MPFLDARRRGGTPGHFVISRRQLPARDSERLVDCEPERAGAVTPED